MTKQPVAAERQRDDVSILSLVRMTLEHRYWLLVGSLTGATIAVVLATGAPEAFTSEALFFPQSAESGASGRTGAIASQFGFRVVGELLTESPQFYADLIQSREVLFRISQDTFVITATDPKQQPLRREGTLANLLELEDASAGIETERTRRWLRNAIEASVVTGMVRVRVTTQWPELSSAIANRLLDLVNEFNVETRQTSAASEAGFIRERLLEVEARLLAAEDRMRRFLEANRDFSNSPELAFELDRLRRAVVTEQLLYTNLQETYEQARIAVVRDTPLITVVERPALPAYPDPRGTARGALVGMILGALVALGGIFGREYWAMEERTGGLEYERVQEVWGEAKRDWRRLAAALRGRRTTGRPERTGEQGNRNGVEE